MFEINEKLKNKYFKNKKNLKNLNSEILQDLKFNNNTCKNLILKKKIKIKISKRKKGKILERIHIRNS